MSHADFSRGAAALGPAISCRCGTLATNSIIGIGARDMPDWFPLVRRLAARGFRSGHSANARGSRGKSSPSALVRYRKREACLAIDRLGVARAVARPFEAAAFKADCTDSSRWRGRWRADQSSSASSRCAPGWFDGRQLAVHPQSNGMAAPLMSREFGPHRNPMRAATACIDTKRPPGWRSAR